MLIWNLIHLNLVCLYSYSNLSFLGAHGVFTLILISLWEIIYFSSWDLYSMWLFNYTYATNILIWVELGNYICVEWNLYGDILSLLVLNIMSIGSFLVLTFVYVEMWDDKEGANFSILLILFLFFMGVLASSGNLWIFYVGWEGIGLVSLFLINFWSERARGVKATLKVFFINKIGDFLIVVAICLITYHFGKTEFLFLEAYGAIISSNTLCLGPFSTPFIDVVASLLIIGGGVKSAQFGFHIWLLEAMEAPLGASALMHSSTLVIAGIILVYRVITIVDMSQFGNTLLILWGSWTALFAAVVACFQYELKIILAYSTISSMGFMYMLLGLGAQLEMLLYLVIHAFIKIFLFLVVGAIMFWCYGSQDSRWMGGTINFVPFWYIMFLGGECALGGLPYFSGYYCKSQLWNAVSLNGFNLYGLHAIVLISNIFTYIYLMRLNILVFSGSKNGHKVVYTNRAITFLLIILFIIFQQFILHNGYHWAEFLVVVKDSFLNAYVLIDLFSNLNTEQNYIFWIPLIFSYACVFFILQYISILVLNKYNLTFKTIYYKLVLIYGLFYIFLL